MSAAWAQRVAAVSVAWAVVAHGAQGYVLNRTVPDLRNSANAALGACPQLDRFPTSVPGGINRRWSIVLGTNILTSASTPAGRQAEVQQSILSSFAVWTSVAGTTLTPGVLAPLGTTSNPSDCNSTDANNTICFAQGGSAFTAGVLAFTNTITSDILGEHFPLPGSPPSQFIGQLLDADVQFNPAETFATPSALTTAAYDLESVLTHELGHFFGFSHSAVWRAIMFPFAPARGHFTGERPTAQAPDAPLSDDDRTGLRVLYPDPADALNVGSITGRILPANPLLLTSQPGVTGIFGAHVVAVDDATGAVVAGTFGGWSCSGQGPAQFDGTYLLERLPVGRAYRLYAEPLDGPVSAAEVAHFTSSLCRNASTDPGWPAPFACTVPAVNTSFVTRVKP